MKKIIFTLVLIFQISLSISNAQWIRQYSPSNSYLLCVKFYNEKTGWSCGYDGIMLKTTNSGTNWVVQQTNIFNKPLYKIFIVDSTNLYSVGRFGTIIKTTNGGDNWITIQDWPVGTGHSYYSTFFINVFTGWICGSGTYLFKTTDGGISFDSTHLPVGYLYDIYFRNSFEGLLCGEAASMYKTTNAGVNWAEIVVPVGTSASDFNQFSFINENTGYIIGYWDNKIYKTTNFGVNWDSVAVILGMDDTYCFFFTNNYTGWAAGSFGLMYKTTNAGYNWVKENVVAFGTGYYHGLYFYNDTIGWAVGAEGKILFTQSGGQPSYIHTNKLNILTKHFVLKQNYPNPFNPITKIKFDVSQQASHSRLRGELITLKAFDITGKEIATLVNEQLTPGTYEVTFDGSQLPSGVYFYKLTAEGFSETKKMILIN